MAVVVGYRNLNIISIEKDKGYVIVDVAGDLCQCKSVKYDSRIDVWEIKEGKTMGKIETYKVLNERRKNNESKNW